MPCGLLFMLSGLVKRDRSLVAFGVHTQSFSGNVKSLFLSAESEYSKVFISSNRKLISQLQEQGHKAYTRYSFEGIYHSLKAGTYVYSGFPSDINYWLSRGAKYVNVWHGTPIKKIERDVSTGYYSLRNRFRSVYLFAAPYLLTKPDALLVSSPYEEKCFATAFALDESSFVRAFPPRLESLSSTSNQKKRTANILYTPTWRDDQSFKVEDYVDWHSFNTFLEMQELVFYIKPHPSDNAIYPGTEFSHIATISKDEDIYSEIKKMDILVSDYSSMIFEGLYLAMPVILFCPDYVSYTQKNRELYIDPRSIFKSAISSSQEELEENILKCRKETFIAQSLGERFAPYPVQDNLLRKLVNSAYT